MSQKAFLPIFLTLGPIFTVVNELYSNASSPILELFIKIVLREQP